MIFFFLCPLTLAVAARTEDSSTSTAGQEWTSHHSCRGNKNYQASQDRESDGILNWGLADDSRHSLRSRCSSGAACGESLDLRTWMLRCTQSDRGPHLFYSPPRLTQRHERYARSLGARFESRCHILLFYSFFFCVILLCGARWTSGWHYGNNVQGLWNSWNSLFFLSVQTLVFITLVNGAKSVKLQLYRITCISTLLSLKKKKLA